MNDITPKHARAVLEAIGQPFVLIRVPVMQDAVIDMELDAGGPGVEGIEDVTQMLRLALRKIEEDDL